MRPWQLYLALIVLLFSCSEEKDMVSFNEDVRPILNKNCLACHGGVKKLGQFSLLFEEEAFSPNESGLKAILPGNADSSEMIIRVLHQDPELRMPYGGEPLTKEEVETLKKWINQGAKWETHWAYIAPEEEKVPETGSGWAMNPVDNFVAAKLEGQGLEPEDQAACNTLIRRLSLDITGLPPDENDVASFCADPSDANYKKLVEKYLDSPHFGEKWAAMWLDLARYADSKGYEADRHRNIWKFRDWVIDAFNTNMPFDQFTVQQIAGDMLPEASEPELIATAFHRNTMNNDEGGTDDEEFRVAAVIDRVNTTWEVWMGTTFACVQCHSHPYDPFTQKEYYEYFSYLNNTADADRPDEFPTVEVVRKDQEEQVQKMKLFLASYEGSDPLKYKTTKAALDTIEKTPIPVMRELVGSERRETYVFESGNFLQKGEVVEASLPNSLVVPGMKVPESRLEMAEWLVSKENPLTSRVIVNRFWEQLFGQGIVSTIEDFGSQGAKPSHPELLDWLALHFRDELKWNPKALIQLLVSSSTYKQDSKVDPEKLVVDPYNTYYSRASRIRLSAEQIRDQALSVSGLLSEKMYGPSVMPEQPEGVWAAVYNNMEWRTSEGDDKYRRALYTYWRRTSPYPSMIAFDSPSREFCVSRRIPTNTPLQALVTLNDPVYLEAAEGLSHRIMSEAEGSTEERIAAGFRMALFRNPSEAELSTLLKLYNELTFDDDAEAMTVVANTILNLDEFLTRN